MSKLLDKLEESILNGDWVQLCAVFNRMTGRNVLPPVKKEEKFNFRKAKKAELVDRLNKAGIDCGGLSLGELRDVYEFNFGGEESAEQPVIVDEEVYSDEEVEHTYIPPDKKHKILNCDKEKVAVQLRDFPTYDDERKPVRRTARPNNLVNAKCISCGTVEKINPLLMIGGANDKKYICPKCV